MAAAAAASAAGSQIEQPQLTYWDRQPPYAAVALAHEAKVDLQHAADPKATKETIAKLQFSNGCVCACLDLHKPPCSYCASLIGSASPVNVCASKCSRLQITDTVVVAGAAGRL